MKAVLTEKEYKADMFNSGSSMPFDWWQYSNAPTLAIFSVSKVSSMRLRRDPDYYRPVVSLDRPNCYRRRPKL